MTDKQKTVKLLQEKIDECDELIVEISQLRYRLEDIIFLLSKKGGKAMIGRHKSNNTNGVA